MLMSAISGPLTIVCWASSTVDGSPGIPRCGRVATSEKRVPGDFAVSLTRIVPRVYDLENGRVFSLVQVKNGASDSLVGWCFDVLKRVIRGDYEPSRPFGVGLDGTPSRGGYSPGVTAKPANQGGRIQGQAKVWQPYCRGRDRGSWLLGRSRCLASTLTGGNKASANR